MVWRRYPFESMWHEMENMRREMDTRSTRYRPAAGIFPQEGLPTGCSRQSAESSGSMSGNMQMK